MRKFDLLASTNFTSFLIKIAKLIKKKKKEKRLFC